jgi:nucleoside-diphosphate kinase
VRVVFVVVDATDRSLQPDGVQRGLVGKIITRFEERGYKLIAMKLVQSTEAHLEKRECNLDYICVVVF